jgi:hypothetical protein
MEAAESVQRASVASINTELAAALKPDSIHIQTCIAAIAAEIKQAQDEAIAVQGRRLEQGYVLAPHTLAQPRLLAAFALVPPDT